MLFLFEGNIEFATRKLLQELGIKSNRKIISDRLEEHPDFPTLLSIRDVISSYGLDTFATRLEVNDLARIHIPFLSQLKADKNGMRNFTVLRPTIGDKIEFLDPQSKKWTSISHIDFWKLFSPVALFAETEQEALDHDNSKNTTLGILYPWFKYILLIILTLVLIGLTLTKFSHIGLGLEFYYILYLIGGIISSLLLLYETDRQNPFIRQVCSQGQAKVNCDAVLSSKGSRLFNISWSQIGFIYFVGGFLTMTLVNESIAPYKLLLDFLSIAVAPFSIYSVYYQWQKVQQWCPMCLIVQGVLIAHVLLVLSPGRLNSIFTLNNFPYKQAIELLFVYALIFIISEIWIKSGQNAKKSKKSLQAIKRIKSNVQIFQNSLIRSRKCTDPLDNIGITLGNSEAKNRIIKVCNPYCGPCSLAHPEIENLLRQNKDLKVTIIFTATGEESDIRTPPVQHLIAIARQGDDNLTRKALNDWYLSPKKDYEKFAETYPNYSDLKKYLPIIKKMDNWCNLNEIRHTPTYFVNGYELPEIYSVADLNYLLKS